MKIVPALLEQHVDLQKTQLLNLSKYYSRFQVDIADNTLVPNTTTQIDELFHSSFFNLVSRVVFDFHLMVSDPKKHLQLLKILPNKRVGIVLIHHSILPDFSRLKSDYSQFRFGLVLNPEDEVLTLNTELFHTLPAIQVMTIKPGFQGSPFVKESLTKIEQLRKGGFRGEILIDGSVNELTLPLILAQEYKPDILGVGSYLTKSPKNKFEKRIKYLDAITDSKE